MIGVILFKYKVLKALLFFSFFFKVQKDPMFFMIEREKEIYPTVYMLWKYPNLLHTFTTQDPVIDVLVGGADLMLPGIVVKGQVSLAGYISTIVTDNMSGYVYIFYS